MLDEELRTLLVTFFGLLSAGILPALTLLVSASLPSAFTVARLNQLDRDTGALIKGLVSTLAYILTGGVLLLILAASEPLPILRFRPSGYQAIDQFLPEAPDRLLQALVFACFCVALDRLRVFVATFRMIREARHQGALEEARRQLDTKAPTRDDLRYAFKTSTLHGTLRPATPPETVVNNEP